MKTIQIKSISLINFKGLRNHTINFDKNTNIYGDNGTGKSTIEDAVNWLWFGKNAEGKSDFELKTLDKNNVVIPKIEHEVSALYLIDGVETTIRKVLKENWVKKKGNIEPELKGNVTEYYWNRVPVTSTEFQYKVSEVLKESIFKIITSPGLFNSNKIGSYGNPKLPMWKNRRNILMELVPKVSNVEILDKIATIENKQQVMNLTNALNSGKSVEDYYKQILASVKKAKEDIKTIPTRIDEVSKTLPQAYDFADLKVYLETKNKELVAVEEQISNKSTAFDTMLQENETKKRTASNLKSEIQNIETNTMNQAKNQTKPDTTVVDGLNTQLSKSNEELTSSKNGLKTLESKKAELTNEIESLNVKIEGKRNEWNTENAKEISFDDDAFHCPTCKRDFESGDVEAKKLEMTTNFKTKKETKLDEITKQGQLLGKTKTDTETQLKDIDDRLTKGKLYVENLEIEIKTISDEIQHETSKEVSVQDPNAVYQSLLNANNLYTAKKKELEAVNNTIQEIPEVDTTELKNKKSALAFEIDSVKNKLRNEDQIKAVNERIAALDQEEKTLAQQISNVEKEQFVIENFNKLKIDTLESRINEKFHFVKFRMFETQINGGESECCDALIDGVPFSDANTAAKINAGLDIINTLCDFYQVTAPIFIDNRESIVKLIPCESQIVNLIVWEGSELHVGNPKVNGELVSVQSLESVA